MREYQTVWWGVGKHERGVEAKGTHFGVSAGVRPAVALAACPRHGRLAAPCPQTGESGPHLGPQGLEPPQPLGQEGDGNTIVSQTDGRTNLAWVGFLPPQAPSCHQGLFDSFGVQPSH